MNKVKEFIFLSGLLLFLIFAFGLIGFSMINGITNEYKYTTDVNCYDKHNSLIEGLNCKHEVYCGVFQKYEYMTGYSCSKGDAKNG